jgi:hypothetical protein
MTPQEAVVMKETFSNTIRLVWEVFGDSAFRPAKAGAAVGPGSNMRVAFNSPRRFSVGGNANLGLS